MVLLLYQPKNQQQHKASSLSLSSATPHTRINLSVQINTRCIELVCPNVSPNQPVTAACGGGLKVSAAAAEGAGRGEGLPRVTLTSTN